MAAEIYEPGQARARNTKATRRGYLESADAAAKVVKQVLVNYALPPDICLQVSDMARESIDTAIRQLTANGGGTPREALGYSHPARTAAELRMTTGSAVHHRRSPDGLHALV